MATALASQYTERSYQWTAWKAMLSSKGGVHQYDDDGTVYKIWFYDQPEVYVCTIWKGTVPETITPYYSQVQNDADKTDFETSYQSTANKRIQRTDAFGDPVSTPIEYAAAFGLIPGVSPQRVTGYVGTAATSAVAIRATAYSPQGTNAQRSMKSSNVNDTSAGTGARTVLLTYLNTSFVQKTETITLNGTSNVNTVASDIAFVESLEVMTVGTQGGGNVGTISLYTATAGGGSVWASIAAGDNKTYWAHHYVPTGKTCYLLALNGCSTVVGGAVTINKSGNPLGTTQPQKGVAGTYVHGAPNSVDHWFRVPFPVAGPDFIWLVERPTAATASTAYGTLEFIEF